MGNGPVMESNQRFLRTVAAEHSGCRSSRPPEQHHRADHRKSFTCLTNKNAAAATAAMTQKVSKHPMSTPSIPAAPTRRGDPETSYEAAGIVNVNRMQAETVKALAGLPEPVEEWRLQERVEQRLGCRLGDSTIRTRLKELVGKGVVVVADRKGVSRAGHRCARYALAEMGVAA